MVKCRKVFVMVRDPDSVEGVLEHMVNASSLYSIKATGDGWFQDWIFGTSENSRNPLAVEFRLHRLSWIKTDVKMAETALREISKLEPLLSTRRYWIFVLHGAPRKYLAPDSLDQLSNLQTYSFIKTF